MEVIPYLEHQAPEGGGVPGQWTHGGDCVSGTIGAVDFSFTVDCATSGMCYRERISVEAGVESGY